MERCEFFYFHFLFFPSCIGKEKRYWSFGVSLKDGIDPPSSWSQDDWADVSSSGASGAFSPDGRYIAAAASDTIGNVKLWGMNVAVLRRPYRSNPPLNILLIFLDDSCFTLAVHVYTSTLACADLVNFVIRVIEGWSEA